MNLIPLVLFQLQLKQKIAWQIALKNQNKIRSFNWYQYVMNGKKSIKRGICHSVYQYAKADNQIIERLW